MTESDPDFIGPRRPASVRKPGVMPRGVRADDRTPWKPGELLVPTDGVFVPLAATKAITDMLSGVRPWSAGANTELVSEALQLIGKTGLPFITVHRKGAHVVVVPFRSGLAELRKAAHRRV